MSISIVPQAVPGFVPSTRLTLACAACEYCYFLEDRGRAIYRGKDRSRAQLTSDCVYKTF